jgi:pyruvate dehydrogenase E2 component (dihydrolipoamide acetyltransferase)
VIAQIETDKATMDLTAFEAGTLQEILAPEGATVQIGKPVARIGAGAAAAPAGASKGSAKEDSAPSSAASPPAAEATDAEQPQTPEAKQNVAEAPEPTAEPRPQQPAPEPTGPQRQPSAEANGKVRASPVARHIAAEHGIDISKIQGTGPQGRIIRQDVEAALKSTSQQEPETEAQQPTTDQDERVPLSQMRRTIARRMAESTRTVPHFFLTVTVDATELVKLRKQIVDQGVKVSFNDLVVKATAQALRKMPEVNVSFDEDALIKHSHVHIGIAVATDRGLIVPVIRDADLKSLSQIASESKALATKAQEGKLQPNDYTGGTFTISNLGMFGIEQFNAVINTPEAAILAVGAIAREPAEHDDEIALRDRMRLTLSVDHRALDGATGARFLQSLKDLLEKPLTVLV